MSTDVQPIANNQGEVVAFTNPKARFAAGPTLAQIEARNARFAELEKADPAKAPIVETGTWSPRTGDVMTGFFLGFATLGRNPKPNELAQVEQVQSKLLEGHPDILDLPADYKAEYANGKIPFSAVAIDTKSGLRFLSRIDAMQKFESGQIAQGAGVYIKCTHEKSGEMSTFEIRPVLDPEAVDAEYTEA